MLVRRRRYLADGEPMEIATSYLPLSLVEGSPITKENTGPGGIYARLEELGHRLQRFTEDVTARMPLPEEVRVLHLSPVCLCLCWSELPLTPKGPQSRCATR